MINLRVGDYIQLKKDFDPDIVVNLMKRKWPRRVTKIERCGSMDNLENQGEECRECPGYINSECYGYGVGYAVEKVDTDWDN